MLNTLLIILLFFLVFLVIAAYFSYALVWIFYSVAILLSLEISNKNIYLSLTVWPLFLVLAIILATPLFRRSIFIRPLMSILRKALPKMSSTEEQALAAGDLWWESELFRGKVNWQKLLAMPQVKLTEEEHNFLDNQVNHLCKMLNDWEIVHKEYDLTAKTWAYLKQEKFFGMIIPKEYQGLGFSAYAHSCVVTKIASRSITAAVTVMVPNSLGPAELLMQYGTTEQKDHYLPKLAIGEEIPCFALTAPDAGSDAGSIIDYGVVCKDNFEGSEVLGIKLNWNKRYITLAPVATLIGLAVKLYDPDSLLGQEKDLGITVCMIPRDFANVETGKRHFPLDLGFMNGPTRGHDVFIPMSYVIGGQEMIGKGWSMLMECLSVGRSISLPALSCGLSQMLYRTTGCYAKVRKQFKTSIGKFEGVEEAMGKIAGFTYMLDALRRFTVSAIDQKKKPAIASAITKCHATELGRMVVNNTMDVHGGRGIMLGENNYAGRAYQAIPISITVEGANILTRNLIIFGQGALRAHPYLLKEMQLLQKKIVWDNIVEFDKNFIGHIKYALSMLAKTFMHGLTKGIFLWVNVKEHKKLLKDLSYMSMALATVSNVALANMGGQLKRKERISARLGDILSYLYISSALIKYHQSRDFAKDERSYVTWGLLYCIDGCQNALNEIFLNYPNRLISKILSFIIFPFGKKMYAQKDILEHKLAQHMMEPSVLRDNISDLAFFEMSEEDVVGKMELALRKMIEVEPIERKIKEAIAAKVIEQLNNPVLTLKAALEVGVINTEEANKLRDFENIRLKVIQVDEFEVNYFKQEKNI